MEVVKGRMTGWSFESYPVSRKGGACGKRVDDGCFPRPGFSRTSARGGSAMPSVIAR